MIRFPSMMSNIQQTLYNGCVLSVDEKMIEIDVFLKKGELKIAVHFVPSTPFVYETLYFLMC